MLSSLKKRFAYYLGNLVYGANDGIITTFAVIAGASGAGFSSTIIIVLGIANLIADGFSMAASKYLSLKSEQSVDQRGSKGRSPIKDGAATFLAFVIAGALPLIPFLLPRMADNAFIVSAIATGIAFFLVGAARALVIPKHAFLAGLEMLIVGGGAAAIAYGLGSWVETLIR
jgi:VIT1/CCC1 family predicted Fe2+/Mn2+ transporter